MPVETCPNCGELAYDLFECEACGEWLCEKCFKGFSHVCRECADDPQARGDRIADGEMAPADAEWLQCSAEEQGEDR